MVGFRKGGNNRTFRKTGGRISVIVARIHSIVYFPFDGEISRGEPLKVWWDASDFLE
jgi:hypothetical protein